MHPIDAEIIATLAKDDDFGFEMRVGRVLRGAKDKNTVVRHGETYLDYRTGVERHFDFQCTIWKRNARLQLAVECKNIYRDSPIVVCGHRRIESESLHDLVFSGVGFLQVNDRQTANGVVSQVVKVGPVSSLYPTNSETNFVGKSVFRPDPPKAPTLSRDPTKARDSVEKEKERLAGLPARGFTLNRDDKGYDQWNQAVGSAAAMALKSLDHNSPFYAGVFTLSLPIVVVPDGTLWEVEFNADGVIETAPRQVTQTTLFRDHRIPRADKKGTYFYRVVRLSHVHFFTESGLTNWLSDVWGNTKFWDEAFPKEPCEKVTAKFRPDYQDGYPSEER
jgi:hypothetical protein